MSPWHTPRAISGSTRSLAVAGAVLAVLALAPGCGGGRRGGGGGGRDAGPSTACSPGSRGCSGNASAVCRPDGSGYDVVEACDGAAGLTCDRATGACLDLCAAAEGSSSYIGCAYWPTPVTNGVAPEFDFAVVVTNPQVAEARVSVTRGGVEVASVVVPAGGLETIRLPWVPELKDPLVPIPGTDPPEARVASALVRGGAYRLSASLPVTVYQLNALDYRIDGDCADEPEGMEGDGQCFSFTNDASLLLPTTALTGNYIAMARASLLQETTVRDNATGDIIIDPDTGEPFRFWGGSPGYVAVTGADSGPVDVTVRFSAHVEASADGAVRTFAPGATGTFSLGPGDVLQLVSREPPRTCRSSVPPDEVPTTCGTPPTTFSCNLIFTYCDVGPEYDLTGTEIEATGKVAVISGHRCAFVPYNRWACDHIEESMFPLDTWGRDFLVSQTQPLGTEPNVVRIVSGTVGNAITFDPASVHAPATLGRGEMLELEVFEDFRVQGSGALLVGQFLVGQDYGGYGASGAMGSGDPALSLAVPTEQFRTDYAFLAPTTYERNIVNITSSQGQTVLLDGRAVEGFRGVGGTGMQTVRVPVTGGAHEVRSDRPFGIVVYGFGSYTSYMYPGGLDFERINLI